MADSGNNQQTGAGDASGAANQQQTTPKTFTQDELNSILAREKRDNDAKMADLKKKADEWDKQQEATKSEIQRERDARTKAEAERDSLKLSRDREKWQAKHGKKVNIPDSDWDRLRGSTEAEIEEDAKAWAKSRGLDKAGGPTPKGGSGTARDPFNQAFLDAVGRGGR